MRYEKLVNQYELFFDILLQLCDPTCPEVDEKKGHQFVAEWINSFKTESAITNNKIKMD